MIGSEKRHDCLITKEKNLYIKSIAILLMLVHHLFTFPDRLPVDGYIPLFSLNGLTVERFIGGFGKVCVCIFLFLSGYGLYISYYTKEATMRSVLQRVFNFYVQFWKVCLVFIPLGLLLGKIKFNFKEILLNVMGVSSSINGEWWFIYLYVLLLLLLPLLLKLMRSINGRVIFGISLTLLLISGKVEEYYLKQFLIYQVYFIMGLVVCQYSIFERLNRALQKIRGIKYINFMILISTPILYIILLKLPFVHYFTFVIVTFILVYCIAQLPLDNSLLKWVGKSSTNIWLTHSFFCYYYFKEFIYAPRYSILIVIWLLFISLITSEGLNWLMRLISKIIDHIRINTVLGVKKEFVN